MDLSDFEGEGTQYRHLLQPVRDLAANFEIDISRYLHEYIEKLLAESDNSDLLYDDQGRRRLFNFAEAAVLIDRSTGVYSKKVEYVHQLAMTFFDTLKEKPSKKRRNEDGTDNLEGGGSDDDAENVYQSPYLQPSKQKSRLVSMKNVLLKLSKKRPCLPIVPISFIPLADYEKTDVPLYNRLNPTEIVGRKDDFKMNICHIYEAVALLDLKNASLIDRFTLNSPIYEEEEKRHSEIKKQRDAESNEIARHARVSSLIQSLHGNTAATVNFGEDEFGDDDGPMFGDAIDELGGNEVTKELDELGANEVTNKTLNQTQDESVLNAHELKNDRSKPFKMNMKCCTVAAKQVKMRDYRIAKECKTKGVPNIPSVKTYIDTRMYRRKIKHKSFAFAQFNTFLMDQAVLSLNSLIYEEEKRRAEIKKQRDAEAKKIARAARASSRLQNLHRNAAPTVNFGEDEFGDDGPMFEDAIDELGADEVINQNEPDEPEEHHRLGDLLHVDDLENSLHIGNLYADGSDNRNKNRPYFSSIGCDTQNIYDDTMYPDVEIPDDLPLRPVSQMDYDELVTYHLKKYWSTAEEATSKFCDRVQKWEEKMTPLLEREQGYRDFDTRQYGDELINHFGNKVGNTIDFGSVVKQAVDYDLSRYLLVSLILANMKNVEVLDSTADGEQGMENCVNHIKLKLVKLERHHEVFDDEQRLITGQPAQLV